MQTLNGPLYGGDPAPPRAKSPLPAPGYSEPGHSNSNLWHQNGGPAVDGTYLFIGSERAAQRSPQLRSSAGGGRWRAPEGCAGRRGGRACHSAAASGWAGTLVIASPEKSRRPSPAPAQIRTHIDTLSP